jgi:hypothetical protein
LIDDVGGGVGPAFALRVENTVAVDNLMVFVLQQRKVEVPGEFLFQFLNKLS